MTDMSKIKTVCVYCGSGSGTNPHFIEAAKAFGKALAENGIRLVYGGGAVGIMMIAIWGLLDSRDLKSLNAPRTLMVSAANAVAVLIFIIAGAVRWPQALAMLVGAIFGGYFGAQIGKRAPVTIVRRGTLLTTGLITLAFFVRAYEPGWMHLL